MKIGKIILLLLVGLAACSSPSIVATQSIQLGDAMNNQNKYDLAIKHYEEYLEVSPQLGLYRNPAKEAEVCRKLAHAYATQGNYTQSSTYLEKAYSIDQTIDNNQLAIIEDLRQLGLVQAYRGNYKEGIVHLEKSIEMSEGMDKSVKNSRRNSLAETYLSLAQINLSLGNYKLAQEHAEHANEIYKSITDGDGGEMECNLVLGIIAREKSQLDESMQLIEQSKSLAIQAGINTSRQEQAIGEIYFLRGEYEEGIKFKLNALQQAEKTNIKPQIIAAHMRLGDAYMQLGDKRKANQYYQQAWDLQNEIGDDSSVNRGLRMRLGDVEGSMNYYLRSGSSIGAGLVSLKMGQLYANRENWDSAYALLTKSKSFFEQADNKEGVAKANLLLATIMNRQNRREEAIALLSEVKSLSIQSDIQWQALYQEGLAYEGLSKFEEAKEAYEKAVIIIDEMRANLTLEEFKSLFANSKVQVYDQLINLLLVHGQDFGLSESETIQKSFDYNEHSRARAFLDMMGNKKIEPKSAEDEKLLEDEQLLRLKIQQITKELDANSKTNRVQLLSELEATRLAYDELVQRMKLNNPAYATVSGVLPPSLKEIQSQLTDQDAIIEYWISENELLVWVITAEDVKIKKVAVTRTELSRQVIIARRSISVRMTGQATQALQGLYAVLFEPALSLLHTKKNLIIIPHRTLHFLPFQALLSKNGKFLIEEFVLSYAPSAGVWLYCAANQKPHKNRFFGLALGELEIGDASPLPGTKLEVDQISRIYKEQKTLDGIAFTETAIKNQAEDYDYIHLATHGRFNVRQPLYSYLLMNASDEEDGRLTVDEIMGMNINSRFVTLSACETGLGDLSEGDDLIGMSRAFIYAGAPQVVVSLWKVDDATTSWLMTRFHQYVQSGVTTSESLAFAQRDMINKNIAATRSSGVKPLALEVEIADVVKNRNRQDSRDPYYWAPFVVIGSNN